MAIFTLVEPPGTLLRDYLNSEARILHFTVYISSCYYSILQDSKQATTVYIRGSSTEIAVHKPIIQITYPVLSTSNFDAIIIAEGSLHELKAVEQVAING